jgi:hypothetical protein
MGVPMPLPTVGEVSRAEGRRAGGRLALKADTSEREVRASAGMSPGRRPLRLEEVTSCSLPSAFQHEFWASGPH